MFLIEIATNDYAWLYFAASQTAFEDANFDACIQYCYRYNFNLIRNIF